METITNEVLNKEAFLVLTSNFYSNIYHKPINVNHELEFDKDKNLTTRFYFYENIGGKNIKTYIPDTDIKMVLSYYANMHGYDLTDYEYHSGIKHTEANSEELHFDGVLLYLSPKSKRKIRK